MRIDVLKPTGSQLERHAGGFRRMVSATLLAMAVTVSFGADSAKAAGKPPNILFIECDSMDGRALGCMGHPAMRRATPNLDALARQGTLFRTAYTNNPICCPSRASMFSGLQTHHCEGWNNYKGLEPGASTFLDRLAAAGYLTQTLGKTDYLSGQHSMRARVSAWTRSANIERPNYNEPAPTILDRDEPRVHGQDWKTTDRAIAWLREHRHGDKPFFLYLGLNAPHPPFVTSRTYTGMIEEADIGLPPADEYDHPVMRQQRIVKNWKHGFSEAMVKKTRLTYFAMIAETDAMLGHLLAALDELGLRDSTCVIFISDHGENAMEHHQFYKMNLYESSARVPLIIAGPGVQMGLQVAAPASLVDIYPTLMDMAGTGTPAGLDGHSLMPELRGQPGQRPDWVLSQFHDTTCNTGSFMFRQGDWKYIAYPGYEPMLFNLRTDPDEIRNLASAQPGRVRQMDARLRSVVDYEAVDARVKAYDRASFAVWRAGMKATGQYESLMSEIFSGGDHVDAGHLKPWTAEDEARIEKWLSHAGRL